MKRSYINTILLLLASACLCSCEKRELPVPVHVAGSAATDTVDMASDYRWQIYFDLKTNSIAGIRNLKTSWDLGFEATASGYHVILNSSKFMFAKSTGSKDFSAISYKDTTGFAANGRLESPGGSLDSTAIGDWTVNAPVYLINRGYNETGATLGMQKIQMLSVNDSAYTVRYGAIDDAAGTTMTIKKDSAYNFSFLSFNNGGQAVMVEPPKKDWTIEFTQYTHIFYDPYTPYLVTGCLLNRYQTMAYKDSTDNFDQIALSNIKTTQLSAAINTIGYDWKEFTGTIYITNTRVNYVIKDCNGNYFKLHFTDFYNNKGVKGNPKWECQTL